MPAKETTVACTLLTANAGIKQVKVTSPTTFAVIQKLLKRRGEEEPEILGTYTQKDLTLFLFGYTTGKEGKENQHELPPPHDSCTSFGDILLIASKDPNSFTEPVPFTPQAYEAFYTKAFDGDGEEELEEEDLEAEADAEADIDAGEDMREEGKEFDEEEEGEEEEEVDEEEGDAEEVEEEEEKQPKPKKRVAAPAAKRKRAAARTGTGLLAATTSGNFYGATANIPPDQQLRQESDAAPLVSPIATPRKHILKALTTLFQENLAPEQILRLERTIYNGAITIAERKSVARSWTFPLFQHLYTTHARHIASNFHPNSYVQNKELFHKFTKGDVAIEHIGTMDAYQLFETRWRDSFVQQQIREKSQLEGNKAMATDQFLCTRCWKRECTYYEMQTRSADEPMTIFITCVNCGKHWRQ